MSIPNIFEGTGTKDAAPGGSMTIGQTSTQVLVSNPNRVWATIVNDSDQEIFLAFGEDAALNQGIRLNAAGGAHNIGRDNLFRGTINAICQLGGKRLVVVEGSAS